VGTHTGAGSCLHVLRMCDLWIVSGLYAHCPTGVPFTHLSPFTRM